MRLNDEVSAKPAAKGKPQGASAQKGKPQRSRGQQHKAPQNSAMGSALADAFAKAKKD
jgi:uncharacterized protein